MMLKNKEAMKCILKGCMDLNDAVKGTLGPAGHHVLLDKGYGAPLITNDGVTIARALQQMDHKENMSMKILYQGANRTNEEAGDGTTTSILLAYAMLKEGYELRKYNPFLLVEGMNKACYKVVEQLEQMKQNVCSFTSIKQLAAMVTKSKELGEWIARAFVESEYSGYLHTEISQNGEYHIHTQKGMQLDTSFISPYYMNTKKEMIYHQVQICLCDYKISELTQIESLLQYAKVSHKTILLCCEDMEQDVLARILMLHMQKQISFLVVKLPGFGQGQMDCLKDIALLTNAKLYTQVLNMELNNIKIEELGTVEKLLANEKQMFFIHPKNNIVIKQMEQLKQQLLLTNKGYERHQLLKRLERLNGIMVTLYLEARTESDAEEKKIRANDAIHACQAALEEGIVSGGGLAYIEAYRNLYHEESEESEAIIKGMQIVYKALTVPFMQLMENGGYDAGAMLKEQLAKEDHIGFDLNSNTWKHMMEEGIVDALKVDRNALENAVTTAALLIRCDTCIKIKA